MALQTFGGTLQYPGMPQINLITVASSGALSSSGFKAAVIVNAPATATIHTIGFYVVSKTTNGNVVVSLETVDATTGMPTGTAYGGSANVTVSITATGAYVCTLGTDGSATQGVAVVPAGTAMLYVPSA